MHIYVYLVPSTNIDTLSNLTRFGVAQYWRTTAEGWTAAEVPAATTTAHATPSYGRDNLYLLGRTHCQKQIEKYIQETIIIA